jgi:pyridoxine 5-phosphate synthase
MPYGGVSEFAIKLFVKIDHVAALRQAQGGNGTDLVEAALMCEKVGCPGITVHLREDRRYIQDRDIFAIKDAIRGKFNLEIALLDEVVAIAQEIKPAQVTLVPEIRGEIVTAGGLDVRQNIPRIIGAIKSFHDQNVEVSLLIEPDMETVELSKRCEADSIQIHTGAYCSAVDKTLIEKEINRVYGAAKRAAEV